MQKIPHNNSDPLSVLYKLCADRRKKSVFWLQIFCQRRREKQVFPVACDWKVLLIHKVDNFVGRINNCAVASYKIVYSLLKKRWEKSCERVGVSVYLHHSKTE